MTFITCILYMYNCCRLNLLDAWSVSERIYYTIMFSLLASFFLPVLIGGFMESLCKNKSFQASWTLLRILAIIVIIHFLLLPPALCYYSQVIRRFGCRQYTSSLGDSTLMWSTFRPHREVRIYEALCLDLALGWINGAPNETRTHLCRFANLIC